MKQINTDRSPPDLLAHFRFNRLRDEIYGKSNTFQNFLGCKIEKEIFNQPVELTVYKLNIHDLNHWTHAVFCYFRTFKYGLVKQLRALYSLFSLLFVRLLWNTIFGKLRGNCLHIKTLFLCRIPVDKKKKTRKSTSQFDQRKLFEMDLVMFTYK